MEETVVKSNHESTRVLGAARASLAVLATLLLIAATQKLCNFDEFHSSLLAQGVVPAPGIDAVGAAVIFAEFAAALGVLGEMILGGSGSRGARAVTVVFAALTGYALYMWMSGRASTNGCGCGLRPLGSRELWWQITLEDATMLLISLGSMVALSTSSRRAVSSVSGAA